MPNVIAYAALLLWPLITLLLMLALPVRRAIIWALIGGFLLLPYKTALSIQGFPDLDKTSIPSIAAFLFAMVLARRGEFRWPRGFFVNLFLAGYVLGPFLTGFANMDPLVFGGAEVRPAMELYDSASFAAFRVIDVLPFILGAGFLRDEASHRDYLLIVVIAALIYTIPILQEIRMSPQLQRQLYGIVDIQYFIQSARWGGFRAMVLLGHGLFVSAFLTLALFASAGLWRQRATVWGVPAALISFYLFFVLVLNKSVGSIVTSTILLSAFFLLSTRRFLGLALMIAGIVISYPVLRAADLVPTTQVERIASSLSAERGQSFGFRVMNEDQLLERARERPILGWGSWGRNRIFAQAWDGTFRDASVTDGTWIITIGTVGWLGYISLFGLLCYPIWRTFRMRAQGVSISTVTLVGILTLNLIDLVPNSALTVSTWLIAGALTGMTASGARRRVSAPVRRIPDFDRMKAVA